MRKILMVSVILSLVVCLSAQQIEQVHKSKTQKLKQKINYEVEYLRLLDENQKLRDHNQGLITENEKLEKEKMHFKAKYEELFQKRNEHESIIEKMRVEIVQYKEKQKILKLSEENIKILKSENKRLFEENAKLKAELNALKNKKNVKKLEKVNK